MVLVLSAVDPRMTIHHFGASQRQGNCVVFAMLTA
jgi:hypothetical protein